MQSETVTAEPAAFTIRERVNMRLVALSGAGSLALMGAASAAVNFTTIEELIDAVTDLIPNFLDLVVEIAPLLVTIAIVGFVLKFLDKILQWLNMGR